MDTTTAFGLTDRQREIVEHSLGNAGHYRNYFATDERGRDYETICELVEMGVMERGRAAARKLGDMATIKVLHDRDVLRLRSAFLAAYEEAAVDQVLSALMPPTAMVALPASRPPRVGTTNGLELLGAGAESPPAQAPTDPEAERIRAWEEANPDRVEAIRDGVTRRIAAGGVGIPKTGVAQRAWGLAEYRRQVLVALGRAPESEEERVETDGTGAGHESTEGTPALAAGEVVDG